MLKKYKTTFAKHAQVVNSTRTGGQFLTTSRDLVITVKLAQFLTDRARSGINRFRILWGVYRMKKIHEMGYGIIGTGYGRNGLR